MQSIYWYNQPELGLLSGILFTDGSALWADCPHLARAGWAVVQVDRFGRLESAAYGPVPLSVAPRQTARDAEDFALNMLTQVAMAPFDVYADCAGTVGTVWKGEGGGTGSGNQRAHFWGQFWAAFQRSDINMHKTKAHCTRADIDAGVTTEWEFAANRSADEFAKKGAALHGVDSTFYELWRGLEVCAREAAAWAAEAHILTDGQDHEDLMERYLATRQNARPSQAPAAEDGPDQEPPEDPEDLAVEDLGLGVGPGWEEYSRQSFRWHRHSLLQAEVEGVNPRIRFILFCCRCGAVSSDGKLTSALKDDCLGHVGKGTQDQLRRIGLGQFPHYRKGVKDLKLSRPHGVLPAARDALQEQVSALPGPSLEPAPSRSTWGRGDVGGREEVLRAFGLVADDRPRVQELGRQAIQRASADSEDPDSAEGSEKEGLF